MNIVFFPRAQSLEGNPYWKQLKQGLEECGCSFAEDENAQFRLNWLLQNKNRVQILHFHYIQQFYGYEVHFAKPVWVLRFLRNLIAARLLGYKIVFTLHNSRPTYPLKPAWADYLAHRGVVRLSQRVIVHCEAARELLRRWYGRTKGVVTIQHPGFTGVYPDTIRRTEARSELNIPPESLVYLFIGGIRPNKGIENLITAFKKCKVENKILLIAGQPEKNPEYLQEIEDLAGPQETIRFYPAHIEDEKIQVFLKAADAVVLPFRYILTSSSAVLAMSFGRPVIAPRMGCLPEQIPAEAGLLYDPADPDGLHEALEKCAGMDLERMGEEGFRISRNRTWHSAANDIFYIFKDLV